MLKEANVSNRFTLNVNIGIICTQQNLSLFCVREGSPLSLKELVVLN
jgi:hypothetical protein